MIDPDLVPLVNLLTVAVILVTVALYWMQWRNRRR